MKKQRSLLLLGFLVLAAAGFWLMQQSRTPRNSGGGLTGLEEPVQGPADVAETRIAQLEKIKPSDSSAQPERSRVEVHEEPELSTEQLARAPIRAREQAIWIEGLVVLPEDMPADSAIEVEARGKKFPGNTDRRTHRVPISADGRFRVAVSPDSSIASLVVFGQYLYMDDPYVWKKDQEEAVTLEPQLASCYEFQVVLPPGNTAAPKGWKANLLASQGYVWPRTFELDRDLRFRIPGVGSNMWAQIQVTSDGFASYQRAFYNGPKGTTERITLELMPEGRIQGTVRDEAGNLISEGQVHVDLKENGRMVSYVGPRANGEKVLDGAFLAKGLAAGNYSVQFDSPGFISEPVVVQNLNPGETRQVSLVASAGKQIVGTVLWSNNAPAIGVEVKLVRAKQSGMQEAKSTHEHVTTTDEAGSFALSGFEDIGPFGLVVSGIPPWIERPADLSKLKARRWERENTVQALEDSVMPGGKPISLVLGEQSGQIAGQVVDETGKPVTSFRISASPRVGKTEELSPAGARRERFEDPDGKFVLDGIAAGTWGVQVNASGHTNVDAVWVEVPSQPNVLLTLPRGGEILGSVVDSKGQPVKATVSIMVDVGVESEQLGMVFSDYSSSIRPQTGKEFHFSGLDAGTWILTATLDQYVDIPPVIVTLSAGEIREGVEIPLPASGSLRGTVHSSWLAEGEIFVQLWYKQSRDPQNEYWQPVPNLAVDAQGRFSAPQLQAGAYQATLCRNNPPPSEGDAQDSLFFGMAQDTRGLKLTKGQEVTVLPGQEAQLTIAGPGADAVILSGKLLEGTQPASGWKVKFRGIQPSRGELESASTSTGAYRIVLEGPGQYNVDLIRPGSYEGIHLPPIEINTVGEQTLDLLLPTGQVTLDLQIPEGFEASPYNYPGNYRLSNTSNHTSIQASSVQGNKILFKNLSPGTYHLAPALIYTERGSLRLADSEPIVLGDGETAKTVTIPCTRGGSIVVTVMGAPSGASFSVMAFDAEDSQETLTIAGTDGVVFELDALPPGDVWLSTMWEVSPEHPRTLVQVVEGAEVTVQIPYYPQE